MASIEQKPAPSLDPRCCDPFYRYGIGTCCGCNRFPVVIYKASKTGRWRCASRHENETGAPPANQVSV